MGRLNTPLGVLIVTTRTMLSFPSVTFPVPNFVEINPLGATLMQVDGWTDGCDEADRCFLQLYECA